MNNLVRHSLESLTSRGILPNLIAGILVGIEEIIFAISIGTLVFSGDLASYLPHGIGIALLTATVLMISIALLSSINNVIGSLQDSPSVIMAIIVASLAAGLSAATLETKFATVIVMITLISLITGLLLLAVGYFKLSGFVRFIPYPVIGGFLAGTGWMLIRGSFRSMADYPLGIATVPELLQPDQLITWLPGVLFAIILFAALHRIDNVLVMPVILIAALLIYYFILVVSGTSIEEAGQMGLLLGESLAEADWQLVHFASLRYADWPAIFGQAGNVAIILILSVIGLLINTSALELSLKRDFNLNHEFRSAGIANILSGLSGGMVGYHTLDASGLSIRLGSRSRMAGIIAGFMCLGVLLAGASLLAYFPKFLLGGLLFFLGMDFLYDWVVLGWSRLSRIDYFVVILILAVIATVSFLAGVAVGLGVMAIIFIVNYSRVDVVRHAMSGSEFTSNVERSEHQQQFLRKFGDRVYILQLQGFIFFGTANALLDRIRKYLAEDDERPIRFLILDFQRVSGLDSSAVYGFIKSKQFADERDIQLVFTDVEGELYRQMDIGGLFETKPVVHRFPDLDHGLEWCEDQLLQEQGIVESAQPGSLPGRLVAAGMAPANAERLIQYLERLEVVAGEILAQQGEKADALYFVENGKLSIYLELENGEQVRLQTLGKRLIVGELGLYLDEQRTASIIADQPSVVYCLSSAKLDLLKQQDPELAATLHEFVASLLAERLADTTRLLSTLYP